MKMTVFEKKIREHRKELIEKHGFSKATVNSWLYTTRKPRYATAEKLSLILGIPVSQIPYIKVERNVP
jgi:transcriptional regulator with XRE-family HTH domain